MRLQFILTATLSLFLTTCNLCYAQDTPPSDINNYAEAIILLFNDNKLDAANELVENLISSGKQHPDLFKYSALINHKKGLYDKALVEYFKALHFNQSDLTVNYNLALLFQEMNNTNKALELYEKILKLNPDFSQAYFNAARIYQENGNHQKALSYYKHYIDLNPDDIETLNNLAVLYKDDKNINQSEKLLKKAVLLDPTYVPARYNLALVYLLQNNLKAAENELKLLRKLSPDHAKILVTQWKKLILNRNN